MSADTLLVLRLSALGDILHTLPAVHALRRALPDRRIVWVVERPFRDFVERIAPVDAVVTVASKRWRKQPFSRDTRTEASDALRQLRSVGRDGIAVDFQGLFKSSIIGAMAGATRRIGFAADAVKERGSGLFLNQRVPVDTTLHVVDQNMQLAAALGGDPSIVETPLLTRLPSDPSSSLTELVQRHPVVVNVGAGGPSKLWPAAHFAGLARLVRDATGTLPLVVWGPGERESAEEIARSGDAMVAPPTTIPELALVLQQAAVVVASDTGPLHLAAALGTPVVALFGPTNPRRNGPYGQLDHVVETWSSTRSMADITPDAVAGKLLPILERNLASRTERTPRQSK